MTQKEIKGNLNDLFLRVKNLESSTEFLSPVVSPIQARLIKDIKKQTVLIKFEISSLMSRIKD